MRYSRQNKIIEIINNNEVDTQEKLAAMLRDSGYEVTQATISRDIKELHGSFWIELKFLPNHVKESTTKILNNGTGSALPLIFRQAVHRDKKIMWDTNGHREFPVRDSSDLALKEGTKHLAIPAVPESLYWECEVFADVMSKSFFQREIAIDTILAVFGVIDIDMTK